MRKRKLRTGVAAVELAICLPILVLLLTGIWEVGRMVEVQQLMTNACREGGRQASTGVKTISQVKQTVITYLNRFGITNCDVSMVTVTNLTSSARSDPTTANQLDHFQISLSIPANNVRWVLLTRLTSGSNMTASADWYSVADLPLTVNDSVPLQ
ncbi:MAG: TadE/TadG family type IV pilus assembly protein [Gemmataceae bacterium]